MAHNLEGFSLRLATENDVPLLLELIKELASYENLSHEVRATTESLKKAIFERKIAEAIIAEYQKKPIGLALYFYNLSTFIGRPGIYLEDLYIRPEYRGRGYGKAMLSYLAKIAKERDCWGLEWTCLEWNEPSINFYESIGAVMRREWRVFRLKDQALVDLAGNSRFPVHN